MLTSQLIYSAYSQGYFPMPDPQSGEIQWYRPDPRAVIPLDQFHVSRSLAKEIRKQDFTISFNRAFTEVMEGCAEREESWINEEMTRAYTILNRVGAAHSVEVWQANNLVGGTYGVSFGGAFFAESMFHRVSNASKIAMYYLVEKLRDRRFSLLECQFLTDHLKSLGAIEIPDAEYMRILSGSMHKDVYFA